ncbi:MAG: hypothetical protein R3271_05210 [Methylophaga sp.]|jgi:hypothetical protein|uniref:hypothetical protein n=1 Tax=Methylophaga sp. TaxID=2024840 RepID=UPI0029A1A6E6|nr:hypothetical protein [Methylophaga sp.]
MAHLKSVVSANPHQSDRSGSEAFIAEGIGFQIYSSSQAIVIVDESWTDLVSFSGFWGGN